MIWEKPMIATTTITMAEEAEEGGVEDAAHGVVA